MNLQRKDLLKNEAYIDGLWSAADKRFEITNPADGAVITDVSDCGADEFEAAISSAEKAFETWSVMLAKDRAEILRKIADLMMAHQGDLAAIMTAEQGKPLSEAKGEIAYAAGFFEWFSEEAKRAYGDVIPSPFEDARIQVIKQPAGVCALITPWNFPSAMIARKVAAALAAGCTVVSRPASETPLSALALAAIAEEAGVPPGVINIVPCSDSKMAGEILCSDARIKKLSFTGSTRVGKLLMEQCAGTLKKLSLELGGNAPFIVFEDADIDKAVEGAIACKFRNAGQTCVCANRIFVHSKIYDAFVKKFVRAVKALRVGDCTEAGVDIGPLIHKDGLEKVERLVADATGKGAKVLVGGASHDKGGLYYQPTVLDGCSEDMDLYAEEIFGPVAALYQFEDEGEVIRRANDTNVGLAAYFYTRDLARSVRVSEALAYGMVAVNSGILSSPVAPFGGVKESGFGREGSKYGLDDYMNVKYVMTAL